jgi:hypothetical protein
VRYWWVNQNQTYRQEIPGGYLWCPQLKSNGQRNPFYEFVKEIAPGDVILCFYDGAIRALGLAVTIAHPAPKPDEFGNAGLHWGQLGWRVEADFVVLTNAVRPVDHLADLSEFVGVRYSPLMANGYGKQAVYLTTVAPTFAKRLLDLIGREAWGILQSWGSAHSTRDAAITSTLAWEEKLVEAIQSEPALPPTEREALVKARLGQGLFRSKLSEIEKCCRVRRVENLEFLRASHTKPWRVASNLERLDGENGFLLTPDIDLLFDRGLITFEDDGRLIYSPAADKLSLARLGLDAEATINVGSFSVGQRNYLQFHRENVFLQARLA